MKKGTIAAAVVGFLIAAACAPVVGTNSGRREGAPPTTTVARVNRDGSTLYVGGSGPDNYTTIQAAVDAASDGDTVFVYDDMSPYQENVMVDVAIHLVGEERETTVIDGNGSSATIQVLADRVTIEQVTVHNDEEFPHDAAVYINASHSTISDCHLSHSDYGIYIAQGEQNNITACTLSGNDGGLLAEDTTYTHIVNCSVHGNYIGVNLQGRYSIVTGCTFFNNSYGVYLQQALGQYIHRCSFRDNSDGIWMEERTRNVTVSDCDISHNDFVGIRLLDAYNVTVSRCTLQYNLYHGLSSSGMQGLRVSNCTFTEDGIVLSGNKPAHFLHVIRDNTVNGKPLRYYKNQHGVSIDDGEVGQLLAVNCTGFRIKNIQIENADGGILLAFCQDMVIRRCTLRDNWEGITLYNSSGCIVAGCHVSVSRKTVYFHNATGIGLFNADGNMVFNCQVANCWSGIDVVGMGNKISRCMLRNNHFGVFLTLASLNVISHNNFVLNRLNGFFSTSLLNVWWRNYWTRIGVGPKPIFGFIYARAYGAAIPWINIDLMPRMLPYLW